MVAKNYCILRNKTNYKKLISHDRLSADASVELAEDTYSPAEFELQVQTFFDQFIAYWDTNLEKAFPKKADYSLAIAVLELFRRRDNLEIFNKKALYIYIREMCNASTPQITRMIRLFKDKYQAMYQDYLRHGHLIRDKVY